jgi:3-hydroxyacyl-CoA dehydrogenase
MSSQETATGFSQNSKNTSSTSLEDVRKIKRVFVVGAGTMGTQIALQCASHGRSVLLYDDLRAALDQAPARLERLAQDLAAKGLLGSDTPRDTLQRIEPSTDLAAAAQVTVIIECVPEDLELKKSVFNQLGRLCPRETILVTNTSSLIPSQLAGSCLHPERLAALHFHLPVASSNVVDLMPHPGTDLAPTRGWSPLSMPLPAKSAKFRSTKSRNTTVISSIRSSARCGDKRSTW